MARTIRPADRGTAYAAALSGYDKAGAAHATDAQLMAAFCEHDLQILMGAFGPRLVWEGAQSRRMTTLELARLCTPQSQAEREAANARLDQLMFDPPE